MKLSYKEYDFDSEIRVTPQADGFIISVILPRPVPSELVGKAGFNLDYTEATNRNEEWTYNYFGDGIKNLVFDVYAQLYNNEFESNSAYFLAGATDEAQYALATGAINNYVNGGWSPACFED